MASPGTIATPSREQGLAAVQRFFEASLFFLIATGVLTLASTGKLDPISTVVPPLALALKAWRHLRGKGPELSHRAATALTVAYLVFFPVDLFFISRALSAGSPNPLLFAALLSSIHLMLFALLVRLYSARTTRDHLFLTMLAFALMLTAAILTVDTFYFALFLVFLVLAVSTFVGLEMRRSAEGSVVPPMAAGTPAARRLQKALSFTSTFVAVGALALGAVIFLIIPRVTAGYLSGLNLQPSLISGFTDEVELGQIGTIKQNKAVVMRVRLEGGPAQIAGMKWRGVVLTNFDGRRWSTSPALREGEPVEPSNEGWYYLGTDTGDITREQWDQFREEMRTRPRPRSAVPEFRQVSYSVLLEPLATDTLFIAAHGAALRGRFAPEIVRSGRRPRTYLQVDRTGSVRNPYHNFQRLLYEAQSWVPQVPPDRLRTFRMGYSDAVRERYLQLPPLDPRIPDLAQRITANAPTAYDKAVAIEQYLRTRYAYTLDLGNTIPDDPLAYFLLDRRAGNCEYFAAAMTVMLRSLGVPARYVAGFLPGEYNDVGDDFIVRASDAHTWVEVFFGEYGWVPFDPTPPADEKPKGLLGQLLNYYDWFELAWSEWVVNYDLNRQVTLAQTLQRASREWGDSFQKYAFEKRRATINAIKRWQSAAAEKPFVMGGLVSLALLGFLLLRSRPLRQFLARHWGLHFGGQEQMVSRLATLHYQHMLRMLARRGFAKLPGQTPLEFAASIPRAELAVPVGELTELYQTARFGAQPGDPTRMELLLGALKNALRSSPH